MKHEGHGSAIDNNVSPICEPVFIDSLSHIPPFLTSLCTDPSYPYTRFSCLKVIFIHIVHAVHQDYPWFGFFSETTASAFKETRFLQNRVNRLLKRITLPEPSQRLSARLMHSQFDSYMR